MSLYECKRCVRKSPEITIDQEKQRVDAIVHLATSSDETELYRRALQMIAEYTMESGDKSALMMQVIAKDALRIAS